MSVTTLMDNKAYGLWLKTATKGDAAQLAVGTAVTIGSGAPYILNINATGTPSMTMPAKGSRFMHVVINSGAGTLQIKDSLGTNLGGAIAAGKMALVVDDGIATYVGALA